MGIGVSSVVRMATRCGKVTLNNMMISNVFIFCVISFNAFWKFLRPRKFAVGFFGGLIFGSSTNIKGENS